MKTKVEHNLPGASAEGPAAKKAKTTNGHAGSNGAAPAVPAVDDVRVVQVDPVIPPQILMEDFPLTPAAAATVNLTRSAVRGVLDGEDDRLIVVVGPCSIHDTQAALEYAERLRSQITKHAADLVIIMRVYFEKPRTTVGWKGLVNDPFLDGSFAINKGLKLARSLLVALNELGCGTAVEFLDTITPQSFGDCVSWGAIGARTTESQVHRELASGVSCAVGFKNGTSGDVQVAADAIMSASQPHHFLGVTKHGLAGIVTTSGNKQCHLILRGGAAGPNYSKEHVNEACAKLAKRGVPQNVMIDCSHGNSQKNHKNQPKVADAVCDLVADASYEHNRNIVGVMVESFLKEGRQDLGPAGPSALEHGVSITDACIKWEDTVKVLDALATASRKRRASRK